MERVPPGALVIPHNMQIIEFLGQESLNAAV